MVTRNVRVGPEDTMTELDTNSDGTPDVRVIQDNAPQHPATPVPPTPPFGPFELGEGSTPDPLLEAGARTWRDRTA